MSNIFFTKLGQSLFAGNIGSVAFELQNHQKQKLIQNTFFKNKR